MTQRLIASVYTLLSAQACFLVADLMMHKFEKTIYLRLAQTGFLPNGYMDVGADHGNRTRLANGLLNSKPTLMVEAQAELLPALKSFDATRAEFFVPNWVLSAAFRQRVEFYDLGTGYSIFAAASNALRERRNAAKDTLDEVAERFLTEISMPVRKADVQGAELEVLVGRKKMEKASLIQLKVSLLPYSKGAPIIHEVVTWMVQRGWRSIEIVGFSRLLERLVDVDLLSARADSSLRLSEFQS